MFSNKVLYIGLGICLVVMVLVIIWGIKSGNEVRKLAEDFCEDKGETYLDFEYVNEGYKGTDKIIISCLEGQNKLNRYGSKFR